MAGGIVGRPITTTQPSLAGILSPEAQGRQYSYNPSTNSYNDIGEAVHITPPPPNEVANQQLQQRIAAVTQMAPGPNTSSSSSISTSGSGTGSASGVPGRVAGIGGGATPSTAGQDAALLRAKEAQGQLARSSLTGLRDALGERGILGSGVEAQATGDIASKALSSLTDINREQLIQNDETARQNALAQYQGDITQRGQDITARGQDINADIQRNSLNASQSVAQQSNLNQLILAALRSSSY